MAESATSVRFLTAVPPTGCGLESNLAVGKIWSSPGVDGWSFVNLKRGGMLSILNDRHTWSLVASIVAGAGGGATQMPSWSQIIDEKVYKRCSCWRKASVSLRSNTSQTLKHALCGLDSRPCPCSSSIRLVKALLILCNTIAKDHTLCGIGAVSCSCKYLIAESTSDKLMMTSGHVLIRKSC